MAQNFRIHTHENGDSIHLNLSGNFDGSSAEQLLELLRNKCRRVSKIIIHTNALREIHPFGRLVLLNNLDSLNKECGSLLFTGENAGNWPRKALEHTKFDVGRVLVLMAFRRMRKGGVDKNGNAKRFIPNNHSRQSSGNLENVYR